jgi:hypothetical protein
MALPIADTPILGKKETTRFLKQIKEDLKSPAELIPTPKIEEARRLVKEYAAKREE